MPDLRGHGWSETPGSGYEKERLANDLAHLADTLRLERFAYIGHDWGGFVGFLLALRSPHRMSRLLALSVPHLWPSRNDRLNPWRLASLGYQVPLSTPLVGRALARAGVARRIMRAGSPRGTFSDTDLDLYEATMSSPQGARTTVAMYRTFLVRELPAIAAGRYAGERLTVPTRLVVGDRDLIVRGADLRGFESHADAMTVERVPRAGHFLPEERPELVSERAESFFA
jgi:pimeloyl-ACP methyl ester carboxylesterase